MTDRERQRGRGMGGGSKHNALLCFTCHPGKSQLSFLGITADQKQKREPLNYSLLLNQVSQRTAATRCEEEKSSHTSLHQCCLVYLTGEADGTFNKMLDGDRQR